MTVSGNSQTQELLRDQAEQRASWKEHEETCQAITEGLADIDAGRTVSFEEARAHWEQQKAARAL